jgi:hypothetical protein
MLGAVGVRVAAEPASNALLLDVPGVGDGTLSWHSPDLHNAT